MRPRFLATALLLACCAVGVADVASAGGAFTLRGVHFSLRTSVPDSPEARTLRVKALASEPIQMVDAHRINAGAHLQLAITGEHGSPSWQHFSLPRSGWARWRDGWRYDDPTGENGPVRSVRLQRSDRGTLLGIHIDGSRDGSRGELALVPPDPGVEASVVLSFGTNLGYCVAFGSDGRVRNRPGSFRVGQARHEACPSLSHAGSFSALSYNVAGLPEGLSGSNPSVNTPLIAERLDEFDLVLVQESWKTPDPNPILSLRVYHEILEEGAPHLYRSVSAPLPLGNDPFRPSALVSDGLNRFTRVSFVAVQREPWTGCFGREGNGTDCLALKGFSVARTYIGSNSAIDVYNLHGEAGGSLDDELLRADNFQQLANFINANSVGHAIVLGGDTNLHTRGDQIDPIDVEIWDDFLEATGLTDVCDAAATNDCDDIGPSQIDKFAFRSDDGITLAPTLHRFRDADFEREDGMPLSDHSPVEVHFEWHRGVAP